MKNKTTHPNAIEILESALARIHRTEEHDAWMHVAHAIDYVRIHNTDKKGE